MSDYYFIQDGIQKGPFSKGELSRQPISFETLIWFHPLDDWTCLSDLSDIDRTDKNKKRKTV